MKAILPRRATAAAAAVALFAALPASAQTPAPRTLSGTVVLSDSAIAGVPVTLHRVTPDQSGPVGTATTASDGGFSFVLPPVDSTAFEVFFATAEYLSVRYFGSPVHGGAAPPDYRVAVYDTASALPGAVRVARRDIVLIPEPQGGWEANEIIRLHNPTPDALVFNGDVPAWEMRLPQGVEQFQAGEGDFSAAQIARVGDRVMLVAPLLPGDSSYFFRYRVPVSLGEYALPIGSATDTVNIFVGQPSPAVEVSGLQTTNVVEVQGQRFVQYGATGVAEGDRVSFSWDAPTTPPLPPAVAGTVAAVAVLLAGSWFALRYRDRAVGDEGAAAPSPSG